MELVPHLQQNNVKSKRYFMWDYKYLQIAHTTTMKGRYVIVYVQWKNGMEVLSNLVNITVEYHTKLSRFTMVNSVLITTNTTITADLLHM